MADPRPPGSLARVDLSTDHAGLAPSLVAAIDAEGGLWHANDFVTTAGAVVARAREVGARALRLDFRDLSFLEDLPEVRYLHLRSDGRPFLDPVASLRGLRALVIETSALRGALDPLAFPDLGWLGLSLGGKGGRAVLPSIERGHPRLEHLRITETRARTVAELVGGFPRLRHLRLSFADHLRTLGDLSPVAGTLRGLELALTAMRSLEGIEVLRDLEVVSVWGGKVRDVEPLRGLPRLRYAKLETSAGLSSLEPLRAHPSLRMLDVSRIDSPDRDVLGTIPGLVAVGRGPHFTGDPPYPDLWSLERGHALRREWLTAISG